MVIKSFPPIKTASPEGLLAIGGDLEVPSLLLAYRKGVFPWPTDEFPLLWFAPPFRTILEFKNINVPKRLKRELKKADFNFKIDTNFAGVIHACAEGLTRNSHGTWITAEMIQAYIRFHEAGYAHSFETYNSKGQLVGGMYGVSLGKMFAGESMFFWESGASKAALLFAAQTLQERGAPWMDAQLMSPLLESFGAHEIPREEYMILLQEALHAYPLFPNTR